MSHLPYSAPEDEYRAEAERRYREIRTAADEAISDSSVGAAGFAGTVTAWLATRQESAGVVPTGGEMWFDEYARQSYDAGRRFARTELATNGYSPSSTPIDQSRYHRRGLRTLQSRQTQYWQSLADDLQDAVRTELRSLPATATASDAQQAVRGRIEKVGLDRARRIAESEPAWGFNRAFVAEAQEAGVTRLGVDMSWETVGDSRVCEDCMAKAGTYRPAEAVRLMESGGFPEHTLCRCRFAIA